MSRTVIVGAGPAGAALAFLLARRGLEVTLVERQTDFSREFRGEVLMPSGIDAIHQMGLAEAFDALPQARPKALQVHVGGRILERFDLPDFVDPTPRIVSQPAMLEMLVERCSAFPGFRFHRGRAVSDLVEENGRVVGVVLRGAEREELRADLVVGADGRASVVRRHAQLDDAGEAEAFDVVWFKVPLPRQIPGALDAAQVFLRPAQICLALPTYGERLQVGWLIAKGSYGDLKQRGVEDWLGEIAEQMGPDFGPHLVRHREALEHPFVLDVVCYVLHRWHRSGVLLLGDAAHPMSPVGGQGLNIALRDAIVAANHLVPLFRAGAGQEALDQAAATIEAERRPEVEEVVRLQRIPPRIFFRHRLLVRFGLSLLPHLLRFARQRRGPVALPAIGRSFLYGVGDVTLQV